MSKRYLDIYKNKNIKRSISNKKNKQKESPPTSKPLIFNLNIEEIQKKIHRK